MASDWIILLDQRGRRVQYSRESLLKALLEGNGLPEPAGDASPDSTAYVLGVPRLGRPGGSTPRRLPRPNRPVSRAQQAWKRRALILSSEGRSAEAHELLTLVQENSHSGLTVREVAGAMRVSIPKLRRQVLAWFGHPPGTIIDLARVARLVVDLEISSDELKGIAFTYSFSSPSAMGRLFKRFVGVSPGRYRLVHRASN